MSFELVFRRQVRTDIDDAYAWYEERRVGLGEDFLASVEEVFVRLRSMPEVHAKIFQNVRREQTRRFPYVVYYQVEGERVVVLAVMHNRRDPAAWQGRITEE